MNAYPVMKKHNPNIPVLMREALGVQPRAYARYGLALLFSPPLLGISLFLWLTPHLEHGKEASALLSGLTEKQIEEKVLELARASVLK